MTSNTTFILLLILFDGAAVAWGVWEWRSLRPRPPGKAEAPPEADLEPPSPEGSGHPEG